MGSSKLILLLKTLNRKEWKAFSEFIQSPYFNKNIELIHLFEYLRKQSEKDFPSEEIQRTVVFKQLFGSESYDEKRLNHLMSQLFLLAQQFLALQHYETSDFYQEYFGAKVLLDREQEKAYNYQFRKLSESLEQLPYRDAQHFHQQTMLYELSNRHFYSQKVHRQDNSLQQASIHFDLFYLQKKLRLVCMMLDRQKFLPEQNDVGVLEAIMLMVEKEERFLNDPVIDIYYCLLKMLLDPERKGNFERFQAALLRHKNVFREEEVRQLFLLGINYCVDQIRNGKKDFAQPLLQLYTEGIEDEILLENGRISPWTYKNIVKLGLGLQQYDWVESFVKSYTHMLNPREREDAYHFNLADLYFHKKDFKKALEHLNLVEFSDVHYSLDAKATLLKIFYETDEIDAMLSLISSFKIFLKRNKHIAKNIRESYMNFASLLYQIHRKGKSQKTDLIKSIQMTKVLNARSWLLKQLE
ncbi:MAG TPA: hypothetical protein PKA00_12660 [Saprospiraceae bacterium]|nr:hypothetical protein [Saprospiraceae bacterium]HMQ83760.1 hypothetical protein [Saprospiraceae bacterium]